MKILIAKLHAQDFDMKSLNLIYTYLSNRKQRVFHIVLGHIVHVEKYCMGFHRDQFQGHFNIFLCDLFYFLESTVIASYGDNTTSYNANLTHSFPMHSFSTPENIKEIVRFSDVFKRQRKGALGTNGLTQELVINELEETSSILFKWFNNNYMKVNSKKSHPLMSGNKAFTNTDNSRIESEDIHKSLGITIYSKLTFKTHINPLLRNVVKWSVNLKNLTANAARFLKCV